MAGHRSVNLRETGADYLRYLKNGHRTFESVGHDIQMALQEQKARERRLSAPPPVAIFAPRKTVGDAVSEFLKDKPEPTRFILAVFRDFYGWDEDPANFQRAEFKAYATHLENLCPVNKDRLAPRTQKNYLNHLTTFLRSTGRVVLVARNEQDATIKRATAVIPNTLVLTHADFPVANKKIKDYYPAAVVQAMLPLARTKAGRKN